MHVEVPAIFQNKRNYIGHLSRPRLVRQYHRAEKHWLEPHAQARCKLSDVCRRSKQTPFINLKTPHIHTCAPIRPPYLDYTERGGRHVLCPDLPCALLDAHLSTNHAWYMCASFSAIDNKFSWSCVCVRPGFHVRRTADKTRFGVREGLTPHSIRASDNLYNIPPRNGRKYTRSGRSVPERNLPRPFLDEPIINCLRACVS